MDGIELGIMAGFITTWVQIAMLYYKIGKLEQKVKIYTRRMVMQNAG